MSDPFKMEFRWLAEPDTTGNEPRQSRAHPIQVELPFDDSPPSTDPDRVDSHE